MTRWIADYRFLSSLSLAPGTKELHFRHPRGSFDVTLRVIEDNPGKLATMAIYMTLNANDLDEARAMARDKAREFLSLFSFMTESIVIPKGLYRLFDWDPAKQTHEGRVFNYYEHTSYPQYVLTQDYLDSIVDVYDVSPNDIVLSAIKWFGAGVSKELREDQYQCFWLVLEVLAPLYKGGVTTTIKCPHCRSDLFCKECNETPETLARTSDGVKLIMQALVSEKALEFFKLTNKIRNKLFHTVPIDRIEKDLNINFSQALDQLGRVASAAILNALWKSSPEKRFNMIQNHTFCRMILHNAVQMQIGPKELTIEELPDVDVQMIQRDGQTGRTGNTARFIETKNPKQPDT